MTPSQQKSKLIHTPEKGIPIGEALITKDGHYALRVKKPKGAEYETVPLDTLIASVVQAANHPQ